MLNRSRFVYFVLHTLLSLLASSLDHLTTAYAVSSRTARPNRSSLYRLTVFVFLVVTAAHTSAFFQNPNRNRYFSRKQVICKQGSVYADDLFENVT